jgi:hypothetical protein
VETAAAMTATTAASATTAVSAANLDHRFIDCDFR